VSVKGEDLKADRAKKLLSIEGTTFIKFKGATMVSSLGLKDKDGAYLLHPTGSFVRLESDWFAKLVYAVFGNGVPNSQIKEYQHVVEITAPDWSHYSHLIGFGDGRVWNTQTLNWEQDIITYVYETRYIPQAPESKGYKDAQKFLGQLSSSDVALAHDYAQAMAPIFMSKRPAGILWFMGDGANGKSALLSALYLAFGRYFASVNTAQLEDGRVLPALNGVLGNIVQEGSESRVEDSGNYKLIGTRQELSVRKLYTQDIIKVSGDFHTIFNANNIPTFGDKTDGVRRRTLLIPFPAHFKDDPTFESRTFTDEFIGGLLTIVLEAALFIHENGDKYIWSDATKLLKMTYDNEVNSAEAFANHLVDTNVAGFLSYTRLQIAYEAWCGVEGHNPLGRLNLKRVMQNQLGAERRVRRYEDGVTSARFAFKSTPYEDNLVWWSNGYGTLSQVEKPVPTQLSGDWA